MTNITLPQDKRVWIGGGAVVGVVLIAISWLAFIGPKLSDASTLRSEAASVELQNTIQLGKINKLKQESEGIAGLADGLRTALTQLPPGSGLADFTREANTLATMHRVAIDTLAVGAITPATGTSVASTSTAGTPTTDSTTASGTGPATTAAASTLVAIPLTMTTQGNFFDELAFIAALQQVGPRVALVTSTQFAPGTGSTGGIGRGTALSMQLTVFSAPLSAAQTADITKLLADASSVK